MQAELKAAKLRREYAEALPAGVPAPLGLGLSPQRVRWHLLSVSDGHEQAVCDRLIRLLPEDLMQEAFVPRRERFIKKEGRWSLRVVPLWRGYVVVSTCDSGALAKALARVKLSVGLVGATAEGWAPLASEVQKWLEAVLDASHVARASVGSVDDSGLHVVFGPLAGQEERVVKIDRHRRQCWVRVCGMDMPMPLEVPLKAVGKHAAPEHPPVCRNGAPWESR